MRPSSIVVLLITLDLILPITVSFSIAIEAWDGSDFDLEGSGSGSGDGSEEKGSSFPATPSKSSPIGPDTREEVNNIFAANGEGVTRHDINTDSDLIFEMTAWPVGDSGTEFGNQGKTKSFLENKDVVATMIAGGVAGLVLAVAAATFIFYKKTRKNVEGYSLAQQTVVSV